MKTLSSVYDPKQVEQKIYALWEKSGFFNPDKLPLKSKKLSASLKQGKKSKTYTIVIPPPNITGSLHMGHALNSTIQDILIRWKRMRGFKTLWLPGTDHAGIATQNVVEKELKKQGLARHTLGREKFLEQVWVWKKKYGHIILDQLKRLGCSCDWSRARFTMDPDYSQAVKTAFLRFYKKGWIYQGRRVVNWCARCATSLSDLELEFQEEASYLWFIKYPLKNKVKKFIIVATTRPETMLGDTAVAVNPRDKRYKNLIGQNVILPIQNKEIPLIADEAIDPKFGTGAVKVTPAHSLIDFEIGQRHKLAALQIINEKGLLTKEAPPAYQGLKVLEARQKIVQDLKEQGLMEKIEEYHHQIPHCYRCNNIIEPLISKQWFLKMEKLAPLALNALKKKQIQFRPRRWEKIYTDWLKNIKDWCISRQIWWGHQIPLKGVNDVLDTWFSSALWPLATLGWPDKKSKDLKTFYPTQTLVTARDIINLWVARMVFCGLEFMKKEPFKDIYIHPTILTKEGRRMSKSLGTGIDPLDLIEKYGADATRFGLAYQIMGNQDLRFSEDALIMGKKFCNKIWNAARFVLPQSAELKLKTRGAKSSTSAQFEPSERLKIQKFKNLSRADKIILKKLDKTIKSVNKDLENFKFGQPAHTLYDFFWHDFCDKYIEASKKQNTPETQHILLYILSSSLKLLHPFMPFITEKIWQGLPFKNKKPLLIEAWPGSF